MAVLRKQLAAVEALLELGLSPTVYNMRRWTPLDEAVSLKDEALVKPLYLKRVANMKAELRAKKALLMESLGSMPDYTMKVYRVTGLKTVCLQCFSCERHCAAGQHATVQPEVQACSKSWLGGTSTGLPRLFLPGSHLSGQLQCCQTATLN